MNSDVAFRHSVCANGRVLALRACETATEVARRETLEDGALLTLALGTCEISDREEP